MNNQDCESITLEELQRKLKLVDDCIYELNHKDVVTNRRTKMARANKERITLEKHISIFKENSTSVVYCERCEKDIDANHYTDHFMYSFEGEIINCLPAIEYRQEQAADDMIAERKERS